MLLLLVGAIVVVMGLVVFWIEPLGVLGVLEPLTPNRVAKGAQSGMPVPQERARYIVPLPMRDAGATK